MALLRELPRDRDEVPEARARFGSYRRDFAALRPELVVDYPPGSSTVDYDVLIDDPAGGTTAITWRADHGDPWALEHAGHWAANYILTVAIGADKHNVTNQHALAALRFTGDRYPELMRELVDGALLALELERERPVLTPHEIQRAADELRNALGLRTAEATHRWMEQMQITPRRFRTIVINELAVARVRERIAAPEVERYFDDHRKELESVRYVRLTMSDATAARELAANVSGQGGLLAAASARLAAIAVSAGPTLSVAIADTLACELPAPLGAAAPGEIVGPFVEGGTSVVAQVLARTPAALDPSTRAVVSARVLREWLDRRAAQATIRWHWM